MNRFFLSIPVLFAASITAAACSSSSSPSGTGPGTDSGGGGTANPDCATLAVCCAALTGTPQMQCTAVVAAGGTNCTTELGAAQKAGACKTGTSGLDGSTGKMDTGTTGGHDGGTTSHDTGPGTDGSTAGGTCAAPTATPFGFTPPTGIVGSGCSNAQTTELGQDQVTDGGGNFSTVVAGGAPDGSLNSCGSCLEATILIPGQPVPATWGAFELFAPEATVGDDNEADLVGLFNAQLNLGGCVYAADPSAAGKKCGLDIMALDACGLATCLPLCAVTNGGASNSDFTALFDCVNTAEDGAACATYLTAFQTDCGVDHNDAGTGAFDKCSALVNADEEVPEAGTPTAMTEADYFGLICGGVDAGF